MATRVIYYEDESRRRPVQEFLDNLQANTYGKVAQRIVLLHEQGVALPFPYSSQVKGRLRELRLQYDGVSYRIFYYADRYRQAVLLHAVKKKTQRLAQKEIDLAEA